VWAEEATPGKFRQRQPVLLGESEAGQPADSRDLTGNDEEGSEGPEPEHHPVGYLAQVHSRLPMLSDSLAQMRAGRRHAVRRNWLALLAGRLWRWSSASWWRFENPQHVAPSVPNYPAPPGAWTGTIERVL
jgi:hypothetical protein